MTTFYVPTKVEIGIGCIKDLPDLVRQYGSHPLLVHGHHPVEDGLLQTVRTQLEKAGIPFSNLGQILPNPKYDSVKRGVKIAKKEGCDIIISLGGGSTLQCAKGIAYGLKYKKNLWNLWTGKDKPKKAAPVAAILTNPQSGDELNDSCTIVKNGKQKTLRSPYGQCCFALLDPALSIVPDYPTMSESFVLFVHLFNHYLGSDDFFGQMDLTLMSQLMQASETLRKDLSCLEARETLLWIGLLSHTLHEKGALDFADLANKVAFKESLTRGAAMSALFTAQYKAIEKQYACKLSHLGQFLFGLSSSESAENVQEALKHIQNWISFMNLPLNLADAGLNLSDEQMKDLVIEKGDLAILKASIPAENS